MKKLLWVSAVGLVTLASTAQAQNDKPSTVKAEKIEVKAIVKDIDHEKREVTIKGPRGTHVMKVGPEVRNLDQVKKGDQILATAYESVAYSVVKKGEAPDPSANRAVYRAEKGERPTGMAISTRQATAKVQNIDYNSRKMTLQGPDGNSFTVTVDEKVGDLQRIKKGDEVVATYTDVLAIAVRTPGE